MEQTDVDDVHIHEHYRKVIAELKQMHEDQVKHMQYKLQSLKGSPTDDEYLVSKYLMCILGNIVGSRVNVSFRNNFAWQLVCSLYCQEHFTTRKTNYLEKNVDDW